LVNASFLGYGDPSGLALTACLLFHFSDTEQDSGQHFPHRTVEVDLLRDGDNSQPSITPVGQGVDAIADTARQPIQLPNDHGLDLAGEDSGFKILEAWALQVVATRLVDEPVYFVWMYSVAIEPTLYFPLLAINVLADR